ncbi:MAG: hypothetical protein GON13_02255 [Nanoarchaeota archaeon]|nr:hypothetical protein [Nanoarchaeota archaeon]
MERTISILDFNKLLQRLSEKIRVIVPVKTEHGHYYQEYDGEYNFNFIQTLNTPKDWLMPKKELLFKYENKKPKTKYETQRTIIFGIKPCDLHAIQILDKILKKDVYYQKKRENTILIGLDCVKGDEHCFCTSVGTHVPTNYDAFMKRINEGYHFKKGSNKVNQILNYSLFKNTSKKLTPTIPIKTKKWQIKNVTKKMNEKFNDKIWSELAKECVECGKCTAICPTCYCFKIVENEIGRWREWDSCQFTQFTRIAGNHVFRKDLTSRVRHRFYHKFHYARGDEGLIECVGCGRCSRTCPANIHMLKVMKEVTK